MAIAHATYTKDVSEPQLQQKKLHPLKKCFWNLFNLHYIKHYIKNVLGIYFLM